MYKISIVKLLLIMKLVVVLTTVMFLQAGATGYAQQVTIDVKKASLSQVLSLIKQQTGYDFMYNDMHLKDTRPVDLNFRNAPLITVLDACFAGQPLTYQIENNTVLVYRVKDDPDEILPASAVQEREVTGRVTDEAGQPVGWVTVSVRGTEVSTSSDANGNYRISIPEGDHALVFSLLGYEDQEISIGNAGTIDVVLKVAINDLDEVVVIGYGTVKKRDLTGSVSSIRAEDFKNGVAVAPSVDQMIGNMVPGVRVVQDGSQPGGGASISIRGSSSINAGTGPLYVIDGLPINKELAADSKGGSFTTRPGGRNPLNSINPNDIVSIEVLKDASATAIYGSRGANGVIMVTTRQGNAGDRFKIQYNGYTAFQTVGNRTEVLNAADYMRIHNDIVDAGGGTEGERVKDYEGQGTDWQDVIYNKSAAVHSHNLSFSGGSDKITYYSSLNYFGQKGIIKSSGMDRYNARLNFMVTPNEKFNVKVNLNSAYVKDDYVAYGFEINEHGGTIQSALNFDPTLAVKDADGDYVISDFIQMDNPLAIVDDKESIANTYRTNGSIQGQYKIIPQLTANIQLAGDIENRRIDTYVGTSTQEGAAANGEATIQQGTSTNYLLEGTLNFEEDYGIHSVTALTGITYQRFLTDRNWMEGQGFPSEATFTNKMNLSDPELMRINSSKFSNKLLSYIGRVNYRLLEKYLVTGTVRIDGSSRFGADYRFGVFPSAAVGWRLNEEPWLQDVQSISELKLRASWGITGNQEIGNLQYITTFGPGSNTVFDNGLVASLEPNRLANPGLKWETTRQIDIGVDFGLWNGRVSGSADYFTKETSDMLVSIPVPSSTGYRSSLQNIGSMTNRGFDFALSTHNIRSSGFNWRTIANISVLKNEVRDLGPSIGEIIINGPGSVGQAAIIREGVPLRSFYGYEVEGIWQLDDDYTNAPSGVQPGAIKYRDTNGDGVIDSDDRTILGKSVPDITWSFINSLTYKNFDFRFAFEGATGVSMLNVNMVDTFFPVSFRRNKLAEPYLNRWTPDNPTNEWPSFVKPLSQGQKSVNSYTVQDVSYLRLKTLRLSYNLPQSILGESISSLSVYGLVENVFTIDDYIGSDPAVSPNSNANFRVDWNATPLSRNFTLGVNLEF